MLAAREHSCAELRRKLCARSFGREEVDQVLDELVRQDLLSDERFTEQYVLSRRQRGFGPLRIRAELGERGIDEGLIAIHIDQSDEEWMSSLHRVHDKKYGVAPPRDLKEQARRVRFLSYRGFSGEQIQRFFRNVCGL